MRIAFVDTYYSETFPSDCAPSYDRRLAQLLDLGFGTSSYYSDAFRKMGWDAIDIIGNDDVGRRLWSWERAGTELSNHESVLAELESFRPDVVYVQDLSFLPPPLVARIKRTCGCRVVGQHSCPWAGDDRVRAYDLVLTSFPHYLGRIGALGVEAHFLPIAFGHQVLQKILPRERHYPVTFVGGVNGSAGHWDRGTEVLEGLAALVPDFAWFGYVIGKREDFDRKCPSLSRAWRGPAWGRQMYEVYAASKIVVNRHGEVARGYANNMRLFEATGMGAMLVTERAPNLGDYFVPGTECITYGDTADLVEAVHHHLARDAEREQVARAGQARTLAEHTYEKRLLQIEPILRRETTQ
jgi:spore maturation protein CgeB